MGEIKTLSTQMLVVSRAVESGQLADKKQLHPKDRIRNVIEGYLPQAEKKLNALSMLMEDMEASFKDVLIYYCEEPSDGMARSQFFHKFDVFIKDYRVFLGATCIPPTDWHSESRKTIMISKRRIRERRCGKRYDITSG